MALRDNKLQESISTEHERPLGMSHYCEVVSRPERISARSSSTADVSGGRSGPKLQPRTTLLYNTLSIERMF